MGCCFSSPSKSHHNTSPVATPSRHEVAAKKMDAASRNVDRRANQATIDRLQGTGANWEPVKRKPVRMPQQPLPIQLSQEQHPMDTIYVTSQASLDHAAGPSRLHDPEPGLKITTIPRSSQPVEPGNVSPVSLESVSTHGGGRVQRRATTSTIRRKYELPPRKRGIEVGVDEAIRE